MSGCPNGCGQHHIANIGFYGASIKVGERTVPAYIAHLAGNYEGGEVVYGHRLKSRLPAKRVPEAVERWVRLYESERDDGEEFNAFVERVGTDRFEERGQGPLDAGRVQPREHGPVHRLEPLRALQGRARRGRVRRMSARQIALETRPRPLHAEDGDVPGATNNGANGNGRPKRLPTISGRVVDPSEISAEVEEMGAEDAIAWAIENFGSRLGFAVSFQKTSSVIIDMAHRIDPTVRFFYLDTELLFPETYETRDALAARYGIEFERFVQDNPPRLRERWDGGELWGADRTTAARPQGRDDARGRSTATSAGSRASAESTRQTRAEAARFGWDKRFGLWKLNPLADWDDRGGLELHQGPPGPVQPTSRPGLPLDRLHAAAPRGRGRTGTRARAAGPAPTGPSAASTGKWLASTRSTSRARRWPLILQRLWR